MVYNAFHGVTMLNDDQQQALITLSKWRVQPNLYLSIQGAAGTGKTHLLGHAIPKFFKKPLITAPTNEAVKQTENSIKMENATFATTFSALGFGFKIEHERKILKQLSNPRLDHDLIVVDEASMLTEEIIKALKKTKRRILFVYHKSQLPPIIDNLSIYNKCYSPIIHENIKTISLEKQMRNSSEIFTFCDALEKQIYAEKGLRLSEFKDFFIYKKHFEKHIDKDSFFEEKSRIITWTNSEVDRLNNLIRFEIFGAEIEQNLYLPGDKILITLPCNYFGKLFKKVTATVFKKLEKEAVLLQTNTRFVVEKVSSLEVLGIDCWELTVLEGKVQYHLYVPKDQTEFEEIKSKMIIHGKSLFGKPRDTYFNWFHLFDSIFAKVKHSYAITTYRAQGTTIEYVYVQWENIMKIPNLYLQRKMLYVAASRAKNSLKCCL